MADTDIEWADKVWNPVTGCDAAGEGCLNCYAARMWPRLAKMSEKYAGRDFGDIGLHYSVLDEPMRWKKPRTVFVNSMGDLFHKDVPDEFLDHVFAVMSQKRRHTFIVLTKRPERMRAYLKTIASGESRERLLAHPYYCGAYHFFHLGMRRGKPLPNVVLGVSCSTQDEADKDIPILLDTPAAKRIVSLEPLLGPVIVDFGWTCCACGAQEIPDSGWGHVRVGQDPSCDCPVPVHCGPIETRISGVIVGGETGPGARPMDPDWVRSLRDQCADANTPFFFKQWGEWAPASAPLPDGVFGTEKCHEWHCGYCSSERFSIRVAARRAGRELDGRTHDDLPWGTGNA